jgi:hypothetical protein
LIAEASRWRPALAGTALAAVILLPFLGKAYTIDDPVFLREAQHVLTDPLHPSAFEIVWSNEHRLRASAFLPGGPAIAYLLLPLALADWQEWAGHLLMLGYFTLTIAGTVVLARRLGLTPWGQMAAGLLMASSPVALGMAGTVMPDLPATMFSVLGVERFLAWSEGRRRGTGIAAAVLLAMAVLTRVNLVVLVGVVWIWGLRQSLRPATPLLLAVGVLLGGFLVTSDPDPAGGTAASAAGMQLRLDRSAHHLLALLVAYLTTTPLAPAMLALKRPAGTSLLWLWLLVPVPIIAYVHFAPKYVLPAVPAAALLTAVGLQNLRGRGIVLALLATAGSVLGTLILRADARMSGLARAAAQELILPRVSSGAKVWFAGHWGFHWYAEAAGASPLSLDPPFPNPGDIVVASMVDRPGGLLCFMPRVLLQRWGSTARTGQVMSRAANAGFYSDHWGLLPWAWGPPDDAPFRVWRVASETTGAGPEPIPGCEE